MDKSCIESLRPQLAAWRSRLHEPWFLAAWPGMGAVAQLAIGYLVRQLHATPLGELGLDDYFAVRGIEVERGLILPRRIPVTTVHAWKDPSGGHDLVLVDGGAQPEQDLAGYCEQLLTMARDLGAGRVCTFAAMATMLRPEASPRVFVAASDRQLLDEAKQSGAEPLAEGDIGGLNGLLIGAAARHGLRGLCLLGEMPYFAGTIGNPKAAAAVLRTFRRLTGIDLDFTEIDGRARAVEALLVEHLRQAEQRAASDVATPDADAAEARPADSSEAARERARERIESLFVEAARDRGKAPQLKAELDRLGWFAEYEDRFLDLFKRAE